MNAWTINVHPRVTNPSFGAQRPSPGSCRAEDHPSTGAPSSRAISGPRPIRAAPASAVVAVVVAVPPAGLPVVAVFPVAAVFTPVVVVVMVAVMPLP